MLSQRKLRVLWKPVGTWRVREGFLEDVTLMTQRMSNFPDNKVHQPGILSQDSRRVV